VVAGAPRRADRPPLPHLSLVSPPPTLTPLASCVFPLPERGHFANLRSSPSLFVAGATTPPSVFSHLRSGHRTDRHAGLQGSGSRSFLRSGSTLPSPSLGGFAGTARRNRPSSHNRSDALICHAHAPPPPRVGLTRRRVPPDPVSVVLLFPRFIF